MSYYVVDVEADGPCPGIYSMVSFGAVKVTEALDQTFYATLAPISDQFQLEALKVSNTTRDQHLTFPPPEQAMQQFAEWVKQTNKGRAVFLSDNPGFDWQFINYYFHHYLQRNPFGWSSRRIGDIYCGQQNNMYARWKHLRKTAPTHHPVDDARGNAEVILEMQKQGLKITLK